jgi:hypothetical protein
MPTREGIEIGNKALCFRLLKETHNLCFACSELIQIGHVISLFGLIDIYNSLALRGHRQLGFHTRQHLNGWLFLMRTQVDYLATFIPNA